MLKSEGVVVYEPVENVDLSPDGGKTYLRANVQAPRMTGNLIRVFAWLLELRYFGKLLVRLLIKLNLVKKLIADAELNEPPTYVPTHPWEELKEKDTVIIQSGSSPPEQVQEAVNCMPLCSEKVLHTRTSFQRWTIQDYSRAYISREATPLEVAKHFLAAVNETSSSFPKMSFFINYSSEDILQQAAQSTLRYEKGEPISVLDGVPIAVKDEIDCLPYPTTGGTKWLHKVRPCKRDAFCVKLLRSCGALIVGKTNMHELGAGTSGINPHYGAARNPYDTNRISGGSSSGSATVVSAGLCPAALGVDGGGSVRLPASLCGVVGFKPTFGRVSHSGVLPLNWTVGMVGVLAGTVEDAFIVYAAISGNLLTPRAESLSPKVDFPLLNSTDSIFNVKMATYEEWFNDCHDDIKRCCSQALDQLCEHYKWTTMDLTIPEIEVMRLAHYTTIGSEFSASLGAYLQKQDTKEIGCDVRAALCFYDGFTSKEYLNAQRLRNRHLHVYKEIFKKADIIVSPTTGVTAYPITDDALKYGELDYINGAALVRYMIAGNFLGLPAVTVPVGYDKMGLPIGLQFIGRPWSESTLIRIAYMMQNLCMSSYRKPQVFYDLLKNE
ncbi:Glutamyl-tRNA(Gln) amidotransferase subunit A [Thalictrum thalictroides]|uniref:Glutamyl-tRNA(Gln) amidotransferase subunit A n=1 Tax=Thalictrum thalictroides TaxID=46969 RepID=A0A7J6VS79_THATH|nr:Glutamyl-tRNA(Gln) amidotransferase subunit A [Thalictrum thalictroides]